MWYELKIRNPVGAKELSAEVHVPVDSPWFDGHFRGRPVLPGIAQLNMVYDLIRQAWPSPVRVVEVSRVRFKQMILPADRLTVVAEAKAGREGRYAFRIFKKDQLICQGAVIVAASTVPAVLS